MNKRGFFLIIALVFTINFIDFVQADVVINEIMYNQPGQEEDLEYIELYNSGDTDVDVSGWTLSNAVNFQFSKGTILYRDNYLIVAKSPGKLEENLVFK